MKGSITNEELFRIARGLRQATGYLELGMTERSLRRLDQIGDMGPLEAAAAMLRGEAYLRMERFDEAAQSLEAAARKFPEPENRSAWMALSLCYRDAGDMDSAIQSLAHARGAKMPKPSC